MQIEVLDRRSLVGVLRGTPSTQSLRGPFPRKEAALLGITICIAAGDDGSSDADMDGHAHADFPSSSPYVLAVGGTTIPIKGGTQPDRLEGEKVCGPIMAAAPAAASARNLIARPGRRV
jgi:hypothetical protein